MLAIECIPGMLLKTTRPLWAYKAAITSTVSMAQLDATHTYKKDEFVIFLSTFSSRGMQLDMARVICAPGEQSLMFLSQLTQA